MVHRRRKKGGYQVQKWDCSQDCVVLIHPDNENDDLGFESDDDCVKSICNVFNVDSEREGN
jgi:hypothetical protein